VIYVTTSTLRRAFLRCWRPAAQADLFHRVCSSECPTVCTLQKITQCACFGFSCVVMHLGFVCSTHFESPCSFRVVVSISCDMVHFKLRLSFPGVEFISGCCNHLRSHSAHCKPNSSRRVHFNLGVHFRLVFPFRVVVVSSDYSVTFLSRGCHEFGSGLQMRGWRPAAQAYLFHQVCSSGCPAFPDTMIAAFRHKNTTCCRLFLYY
jgi:hypothetical protein